MYLFVNVLMIYEPTFYSGLNAEYSIILLQVFGFAIILSCPKCKKLKIKVVLNPIVAENILNFWISSIV